MGQRRNQHAIFKTIKIILSRKEGSVRVCVCVYVRAAAPSPPPRARHGQPCPGYLSGLRSTMPITKIFFPGLIPPLMCPQKGTIWKGQGEEGGGGQLGISGGRPCSAGAAGSKGGLTKRNTPPPPPPKITKPKATKVIYQAREVHISLHRRSQGVV